VRPSHLPGDKAAKLAPLEPIFDAGNIHLLKAPWNDVLIRQFNEFPDGAHDDYCLVAGTLITTKRGDIPIERVKHGDKVLTRFGWKRVIWSGKTGSASGLSSIHTASGASLTGTPEHRVWNISKACWNSLDSVAIGDRVMTLNGAPKCKQKKSSIAGKPIRGTQKPVRFLIGIISSTTGNGKVPFPTCTGIFGQMPMDRFQPVITFTTKTGTGSTIHWKTLKRFPLENIAENTHPTGKHPRSGSILKTFASWHQNGIGVRRVKRGIENNAEKTFATAGNTMPSALNVENRSKRKTSLLRGKTDSVAINAVTRITTESAMPVYNLAVEDAHEFFANGILVHNCDPPAIIYGELAKGGSGFL
jgi:hypothetical protein